MVMGKKSLDGEVALLLPFTGSYAQYAQAVLKGVQLALHPSSGEPDISLGLEIFDTGGEL
jgi:outer membrane PBP1 activator LpoA protein